MDRSSVFGALNTVAEWFESENEGSTLDGRLVVHSQVDWEYRQPHGRRWTWPEIEEAKTKSYVAETPCCKQIRQQDRGVPKRTVFYINGIMTSPVQHERSLRQTAEVACKFLIGVYNSTRGFLLDAIETGYERLV